MIENMGYEKPESEKAKTEENAEEIDRRQPSSIPEPSDDFEKRLKAEQQTVNVIVNKVERFVAEYTLAETNSLVVEDEKKLIGLDSPVLRARIQSLEQRVETAKKSLEGLGQVLKAHNNEFELLGADDLESAQRASDTFEKQSSILIEARRHGAAMKGAEKEMPLLIRALKQVRLREHGLASTDDYYQAKRSIDSKLFDLRGAWFGIGRFSNKETIKQLEQKQQKLHELSRDLQQSEYYYARAPIDSYELDRVVADSIRRMTRTVDARLLDFSSAYSVREENRLLIDSAFQSELTESYIEQWVMPAIEAGRKEMKESIEESEESDSAFSKENIEAGIRLLKERFSLPSEISWVDRENSEKNAAIYSEMQKLPWQLSTILGRFQRSDAEYQEILDFIGEAPMREKGARAGSIREEWRRRIKGILENNNNSRTFQSCAYELRYRDIGNLTPLMSVDELWGMDLQRYRVATANPNVLQHFGTSRIEKANGYIEKSALAQLFIHDAHTDESMKVGRILQEFGSVQTLPIFLMNAYREPGHSGEWPFLGLIHTSGENPLVRQIKKSEGQALESLETKTIPGFKDVVELIRRHPEDFHSRGSYKGDIRERNPVYDEINVQLTKMLAHYFEHGEPAMQRFLAETCEHINADLGENYIFLERLVKGHREDKAHQTAIRTLIYRMQSQHDPKAAEILFRNHSSLSGEEKPKVKRAALDSVFSVLALNEEALTYLSPAISEITGKSAAEIQSVCEFLKETNTHVYPSNMEEEHLNRFFLVAGNASARELAQELRTRGYELDMEQYPILAPMAKDRARIIADIDEIRTFEPDFRYHMIREYTPNSERKYISDPYSVFAYDAFRDGTAEKILRAVSDKKKKESIEKISRGLLIGLRNTDPQLRYIAELPDVTDAKAQEFEKAIEKILAGNQYSDFFFSKEALYYLSRQPERVDELLQIPERVPRLLNELLAPGGPLHTNRKQVIADIFSNGNALQRAQEIAVIFEQKLPYWRLLYLFTRSRLGAQLSSASTAYPINSVGRLSFTQLVKRHEEQKQENSAIPTRLEQVVGDRSVIDALVAGQINQIPFHTLSGPAKHMVFRDFLRGTVERSRDLTAKAERDKDNRAHAEEPLMLTEGTYLHGSALDYCRQVLLNGNLCGEALGEAAKNDSYPFQVDFSCLTPEYLKHHTTIRDAIEKSISGGGYGESGKRGQGGKIVYVYDRSRAAWERGVDYNSGNKEHGLMLGGIPSTEITAIVLKSPEMASEDMKSKVMENGFYIPLYDYKGTLLFTPEEFDRLRDEHNAQVPIEPWDASFKSGEQLGSNAGGEYTVPEGRKPTQYYVKFEKPEGADHLWNEQLADNIYRHLGIAVPVTKVVTVDGSIGHGSKIMEGKEASPSEFGRLLKDGFIADCLLANWDMPAKTDNSLVGKDGKLYRIDNGGALLFRAQGARKESLGEVVSELETMKYGYGQLSRDELQAQVEDMKKRMTDQAIDALVDGVRLHATDREYLKAVLRKRRDYIVEYFEPTELKKTGEISELRRRMEVLLSKPQVDDSELGAMVKEWGKISGEKGYQHNGAHLGEHIKSALAYMRGLKEFERLKAEEQHLALLALLFHDIAKPTGEQYDDIPRDFSHEIPSAALAASYMKEWGYSVREIGEVMEIIVNDGIPSDMARGKVRDEGKRISSSAFKKRLSSKVLRVLKLVNQADVVATVGEQGFRAIEKEYEKYFE